MYFYTWEVTGLVIQRCVTVWYVRMMETWNVMYSVR